VYTRKQERCAATVRSGSDLDGRGHNRSSVRVRASAPMAGTHRQVHTAGTYFSPNRRSVVLIQLVPILACSKHRRHRQRHHHDLPTDPHRVRPSTTSPQKSHRHTHLRTTSDVQSYFQSSFLSFVVKRLLIPTQLNSALHTPPHLPPPGPPPLIRPLL
jgi:hypothetical protein